MNPISRRTMMKTLAASYFLHSPSVLTGQSSPNQISESTPCVPDIIAGHELSADEKVAVGVNLVDHERRMGELRSLNLPSNEIPTMLPPFDARPRNRKESKP